MPMKAPRLSMAMKLDIMLTFSPRSCTRYVGSQVLAPQKPITAQVAAKVPSNVRRSSCGAKISLIDTWAAKFAECWRCALFAFHSADSGTNSRMYSTGISVEMPASRNSSGQLGSKAPASSAAMPAPTGNELSTKPVARAR
ncbi:hypothetical protein D3C72_1319880 [compost metagenome]